MERRVFYLGGNGHCAARLAPARAALARLSLTQQVRPFELVDVPYPGFEGRPRALDFETFLTTVAAVVTSANEVREELVYATGIGGLLALCIRARGEWRERPLLFQAPVLWGLEHRLMPKVMRLGCARFLLGRLFATSFFQARFVRRQFEKPLAPETRAAFFEGYARCTALPDFFAWLTPRLLRRLEVQLASRREALNDITVWWGGQDQVVDLRELDWTEKALRARWPLRTFPSWGHYPMLDEPEDWVRALDHVLAEPGALSGQYGPQAQ